jgi:LytS/YehU family sensor histidine kinase
LTEHYVLPYFYQEYTHSITGTSIIKQFMAALMILPLPIIYRISVFLYQNQRAKLTLEAQKLESELKLKEVQLQLLNHQLQPHFLFNTLNNLYSLAYHKSDQTLEVITRISDLLSFVIYDCNSDTIALEKEIQLLRTYIELEKIRYGKRLTVDFVLHGNINGYSLPPMLLFPFLENSFKHGASTDYKNPWIKIKLNIEDSQLTFQIENSKTNGGNIEIQEDRTRVGILNTRKRLDLLYPSRYKLEISDNVVAYKVELVLPL